MLSGNEYASSCLSAAALSVGGDAAPVLRARSRRKKSASGATSAGRTRSGGTLMTVISASNLGARRSAVIMIRACDRRIGAGAKSPAPAARRGDGARV